MVLVLTISLLTACGGGDGSNSPGGGDNNPPSGDSDSKSDDDNTTKDSDPPKSTEGGSKESTGGIRTPDITVKPGDMVFSNEYMSLVYERVNEELMFVFCKAWQETTEGFYVNLDAEPLVINGIATTYKDFASFYFRPLKEGENTGSKDFPITYGENTTNALEIAGITPDQFESLQVTITIKDDTEMEVYQITVLFIIEHD